MKLSNSPRLLIINQSNKTKWLHTFEKKKHMFFYVLFFLKEKNAWFFFSGWFFDRSSRSSVPSSWSLVPETDPWKRCQRSTRRSSWRRPKYPRKPRFRLFFAATTLTVWTFYSLDVALPPTTTIKRKWRCRVGVETRGVVGKKCL